MYDLKCGAEQDQQAHTNKLPEVELLEQTKHKDFLAAVQELQDRANSLNMQNKYISEQKTELESTLNEKRGRECRSEGRSSSSAGISNNNT